MNVLGLNAYHGDAAAAVLTPGGLASGVEEERFTRVKHWAGFPRLAMEHCLREIGSTSSDGETAFAVSRLPKAHFWRKAALALSHPRSLGRSLARVRNIAQLSSLEDRLAQTVGRGKRPPKLYPVEHHLAHAASAFLCSPFDEAACLTVDGFGDFVSTMLAVGKGQGIDVLQRVHFPHSLGLFYTALTQHLGFPKYGDEYKVMGLAGYGEPRFVAELRTVVPGLSDGTFRLDLQYFRHLREGVDMTWDDGEPKLGDVFTMALERLLGPRRHPQDEVGQRHKDLAASLQAVYEERFFAL